MKTAFSRRRFLKNTASAAVLANIPLVISLPFSPNPSIGQNSTVNFGFITDLHHGLCKDAMRRLNQFITDAQTRSLDFIIQGGDFCFSEPGGQECVDLWNTYSGDKFHVLGNHDMDKGSKKDIMKMWSMDKNYYSFDRGNFHFVVLDANFIYRDGKYYDYDNANFYIPSEHRAHVNPEQLNWLKQDLKSTNKQTLIFSHQAFDELWDKSTSPSRFLVRKIIEDANSKAKFNKVIACFCGHHHLDQHSIIDDVHYFQMNSASYYWAGKSYGSDGAMAMYSKPLYAYISVSSEGKIIIEGRQGSFIKPTPLEKGHPEYSKLSASIESKAVSFIEHNPSK